MELPELPKLPAYESAHDEAPLTDHYSADQMRAYALEAIAAERERILAALRDWDYDITEESDVDTFAAAIRAQGSKT